MHVFAVIAGNKRHNPRYAQRVSVSPVSSFASRSTFFRAFARLQIFRPRQAIYRGFIFFLTRWSISVRPSFQCSKASSACRSSFPPKIRRMCARRGAFFSLSRFARRTSSRALCFPFVYGIINRIEALEDVSGMQTDCVILGGGAGRNAPQPLAA